MNGAHTTAESGSEGPGAAVAVRVPGRVNLIGDHTDYTGGLALPMAIDRWTVLSGHRGGRRVMLESADEDQPVEIPLPLEIDPSRVSPDWGRFVAGVIAEMQPDEGVTASIHTTIPVGAGLSSSAALGVGVALALGFDGSAVELAQLVRRSEHRATGVPTGIMDQLCIASATAGHATLIDCQQLEVTQIPIPDDAQITVRFIAHRTLDGSPYAERVAQCHAAEAVIGPLNHARPDDLAQLDDPVLYRRARHVISENERVRQFADALSHGDLFAAGEIMSDGHRSLRDDYEVSTAQIDQAVEALIGQPGVYGARLTGGGFGGCVVALCRPGTEIAGAWVVRPVGAAEHNGSD
jgi:galactokinase